MRVTSLSLSHFRNYERALIEPDAGVTVFTGPNAQGKTNVLEALHLCCLGKSHRTSRDEELIQWGRDSARVTVKTAQRDGTHAYYYGEPVVHNEAKGLAPMLLATAELLRL